MGKNIWKAVNKLAGTKLEKEFREAMDKREIRQFEWKTLYTEGYREFTLYPSVDGITVYGKDITERKKAEKHNQELLENEQQLTEELRSSNEELQDTTGKLLTQTDGASAR